MLTSTDLNIRKFKFTHKWLKLTVIPFVYTFLFEKEYLLVLRKYLMLVFIDLL